MEDEKHSSMAEMEEDQSLTSRPEELAPDAAAASPVVRSIRHSRKRKQRTHTNDASVAQEEGRMERTGSVSPSAPAAAAAASCSASPSPVSPLPSPSASPPSKQAKTEENEAAAAVSPFTDAFSLDMLEEDLQAAAASLHRSGSSGNGGLFRAPRSAAGASSPSEEQSQANAMDTSRTSPAATSQMEEDDQVARVEQTDETEDEAKTAQLKKSSRTSPFTFLIHSSAYAWLLDSQAVHCGRMRLFSSLLRSFHADRWPGLTIVPPRMATQEEIERAHSRGYLQALERISRKLRRNKETGDAEANHYGVVEESEPFTEEDKQMLDQYGLKDDCPPFPELWQMVRATMGGSLRAVECILQAQAAHPLAPITVCHWGGGRHHAESDCAKGFCYCADIVLAILRLLSSPLHPRVLYLDLDCHHGDAVEEAFAASASVMTCSFHHRAPGFFPGTGGMDKEGVGRGKHTSDDKLRPRGREKLIRKHCLLNVPLHEGIDDATFYSLVRATQQDGCGRDRGNLFVQFSEVLSLLLSSFRPSAVVVCCGVDGLASDRMSPFNLTTRAYEACVHILKRKLGHMQYKQNKDAHTNAQQQEAAGSEQTAAAAADGVKDSPLPSSSPLSSASAPTDAASLTVLTCASPVQSTEQCSEQVAGSDENKTESSEAGSVHPPPATASPFPPPLPLLLLGGGGYCPADSARAFAHMTAAACSRRLPGDIPDSDPFYPRYLTQMRAHSHSSKKEGRENMNTPEYLESILQQIQQKCRDRERQEQEEED